ncbi:MAG: hypothetical protein HC887_10375 [Desulfobacteraceae bacterium]|nr:hypothetical protein [Desulfobacteraceae bacterium]
MNLGIFCLLAILVYTYLSKVFREKELKKQRLEKEARNRESEKTQKINE